jgi:hypothetical protein
MFMHSGRGREAHISCPCGDDRHVRRYGSDTGTSDGGRGADFVPMMSAAHSDDAPIADDVDRESMSKDVEERA